MWAVDFPHRSLHFILFLLYDLFSEQKVRNVKNSRLTKEKLKEESHFSDVRCANTISSGRHHSGSMEGGSALFKHWLMRPTAVLSGSVDGAAISR